MKSQEKSLREQNNQLDEKLTPENNKILTDIVCYFRASSMPAIVQEQVRLDLIEMALSAQQRGEPLTAVIGQDLRGFCDEIIASVPKRTWKERLLSWCDSALLLIPLLGFINLAASRETWAVLQGLWNRSAASTNIPVTLGGVLSLVVILGVSIGMVEWICRNPFEDSSRPALPLGKRLFFGALLGLAIAGIFLLLLRLRGIVLFSAPLFWVAGILLGMLILRKIICR